MFLPICGPPKFLTKIYFHSPGLQGRVEAGAGGWRWLGVGGKGGIEGKEPTFLVLVSSLHDSTMAVGSSAHFLTT